MDIRYATQPSEYTLQYGRYVSGEWSHMPFADNSFDRLIGYESFPKYITSRTSSLEDIKHNFREVTRVARQGAIWRATLPKLGVGSTIQWQEWMMENGWEAYHIIGKNLLIAKLTDKD